MLKKLCKIQNLDQLHYYCKVYRTRRPNPQQLFRDIQSENVLPEGYSIRWKNTRPFLFAIVPQGEGWILERWGKFDRLLEPGFHLIMPVMEKVAFKHSLKEITFIIHKQQAITKDNVTLDIDGICYCRIYDPEKASYEVESPFFAITNLAQTTMRSEIGKITLDQTFEERQNLNVAIVNAIKEAASHWGILVERYEIRDISVPNNIKRAMELEAEAERKKRQEILLSEANRQSAQNVAEGEKVANELTSEGEKIKRQNLADGAAYQIETKATAESMSIKAIAKANAEAICLVSEAIKEEGGKDAVSMELAKNYIEAYAQIAQEGNTIIIPHEHNNIGGVVAQSLAIFDSLREESPEDLAEKLLLKEGLKD